MKTLNEERLKQIILCILAEITKATDMDKETYLEWLELEAGISKEELQLLSDEGFLPIPVELNAERE